MRKLRFANADDGWAFLPDVWATHDGGGHWIRQSIGRVFALETASGVAVWNDRPPAVLAYRSIDGGSSFRIVAMPLPTQGASGLAVADPNVWVVGSTDSESRALLLRTADGGRTWRTVDTEAQGVWLDIGFTSSKQGVGIDDAATGRLFMTFDAGQTWAPVATR